tara:strand:+ start:1413 stop:2321 length:909 start_codon:yes stop_codon:yes gene_type:complete
MVLYTCTVCNYSTTLKGNFKKHELTKKHIVNSKSNEKSEIYTCIYCSKKYTRKDNLKRHMDSSCNKYINEISSKNKKEELLSEIDKLKHELDMIKGEQNKIKDVLEEKDNYITQLKENNKCISHSHFQIIQNNIITMNPIKFLNTYYNNNPSFDEIANTIINKSYDQNDLKLINDGIKFNNKNVLGEEIDSMIKNANLEIIKNNNINSGFCNNVIFVNDGSTRKYITKGDPGWDYYQSDETLDSITSKLIDNAVELFNNNNGLFSKKDRNIINRIIKNKNSYNECKDKLISNAIKNNYIDIN